MEVYDNYNENNYMPFLIYQKNIINKNFNLSTE